MSFTRFRRPTNPDEDPVVSIRDRRFHFNAAFSRAAELKGKRGVIYYLDDEKRKIAFEFCSEKDNDDCYTLEDRNKAGGFRCSAWNLISSRSWIRSASELADNSLRSFRAKRDGKYWVIQLMPAFEYRTTRDKPEKISNEARGIYRYLSKSKEVLYIGKGVVKDRLRDPSRKG